MTGRNLAARSVHKKIGDRTCRNCRAKLREHCTVHIVPCCPGNCSGRTTLDQLLARLIADGTAIT